MRANWEPNNVWIWCAWFFQVEIIAVMHPRRLINFTLNYSSSLCAWNHALCTYIYIWVFFNHLSFVCCSTKYQRISSAPLLGYISVVKPHGDWCSCWNHIRWVMLLTQEDNLSSQRRFIYIPLYLTIMPVSYLSVSDFVIHLLLHCGNNLASVCHLSIVDFYFTSKGATCTTQLIRLFFFAADRISGIRVESDVPSSVCVLFSSLVCVNLLFFSAFGTVAPDPPAPTPTPGTLLHANDNLAC